VDRIFGVTNSGLRSTTLIRFVAVVLLLPTIVGVAIFIVIALLPTPLVADFDPNADAGLRGTIESVIIFAAFFGAAYGPVLIPIAAMWLLIAQRRGTARLGSSWALIVLALAAATLSYGWALDAVELP
jgi:hypothetical protein